MASLVKKIISTARAPAALGPYRYASARGRRSLGRSSGEREQVLPVGFRAGPWRGGLAGSPGGCGEGRRVPPPPPPRAGTDLLPGNPARDTWDPTARVGLQC